MTIEDRNRPYLEQHIVEMLNFAQTHCFFCGKQGEAEVLVYGSYSLSSFVDPMNRLRDRTVSVGICEPCNDLVKEIFVDRKNQEAESRRKIIQFRLKDS